jgi:hypothetical protein
MSDISDTIKNLYREFILRDLLSFITPGAIVVGTIVFLQWDISQILEFFKAISWFVYIPIFGASFMVGFAIQCLGEIAGIIKFHNCNTDAEHWQKLIMFRSKADDKTDRQHERFVVLKQMCGNGAGALLIASVFVVIKLWIECLFLWVLGFLVVLLVYGLYRGHRIHLRRQEEFEDLILNDAQDK